MIVTRLDITRKWHVSLTCDKQIAIGGGILWGAYRFYASICLGPFELSLEIERRG